MTVKWSTDLTANMATRRDLAADLPHSQPSLLPGWRVGCGYAARAFLGRFAKDEPAKGMLRVVRLSDGATWTVSGGTPSDPKGQEFYWDEVYGVTCSEVWALAVSSIDSGTYRIRLDSLGPPTPAAP